MEERRENIMGTQPINRLLPSMAFPIMLSMLVQALYNVVDSVFVSMVSENALTSVSLAFPVQNLMIAVSVGTAVGINALLSRRLGEKNFEAANKVAENGIFVTVLSWAVFAVFGAACSGLFMGAFTQNAEILAGGTDYMWIVTVFSLGLFMSVTMERVLQVTGKTVYQMISQMTGAVVNIILDPVFIFGWLGLTMVTNGTEEWLAVLIAFIGGFLAMLGVAFLLKVLSKLQSDGTMDIRYAIGVSGSVYISVPPQRSAKGKVNLLIQGKLEELDAVTDEETPLPFGTEVVVTGISGGNTLIVRRK